MNVTQHTARRDRRSWLRPMLVWAAAIAITVPLLSVVTPAETATAATALPDGLTSPTAAGSCWEAKQNYPSSADGVYWVVTPTLKAPTQVYCDMTTDGGGWALVGRGREGWKNYYNGLRPTEVYSTPSGTAAFKPAQMPAQTVDGLLNGSAVKDLADGIRLRRASNQTGTTFQEVRFTMPKRDRWVWTFRAEHPVGTYRFDGVSGSGGQTVNFGNNSAFRRVDQNISSAQGWLGGFAYGSTVTGVNSATSYLWSNTTGAGGARPFTQVFIRPKLTIAEMNFGTIPDAGAPAQTLREMPESNAITTRWGVTGQANGIDGELDTEVAAFGQVGNTVYVGGNFQYVQRTLNATGANKIERKFLAAFDVNTGEFIPTFLPNLNGQVKAIMGLPDGRLAVGGDFSQVDGAAQQGFVVLNAQTGAKASGWQARTENRNTGGTSQVRGFSMNGPWLYLSGSFTHVVPSSGPTASTWNGARINVTTGAPSTDWNPNLNGTSVGVEAAAAGDRAYFSGYFQQTGGNVARNAVALQSTSGAAQVQPVLTPIFSGGAAHGTWQLGIAEASGNVFIGGSEHSLIQYDRTTFASKAGSITKNGGDFQAVEATGNTIFGGCHCGDFSYSNAYSWPDVGSNWTQGDSINLLGAWDATSGAYLPEFNPIVQARRGFGAWAFFTDSNGNLWTGGDYAYSVRAGELNQWSGGFIRFAPRDIVAPSKPGAVSGSPIGTGMTHLSWGGSTDNRSAVSYEVIRDNKVVVSTTSTSFDVPTEETPTRYFVRAIDSTGNRSATTAVYLVAPPSASDLTFISSNANWKWRFDSAAWPADWRVTAFNDSAWASGNAVLGLGTTGLGTNIGVDAQSPRPLSAQFRRAFTVSNPLTVVDGKISVIADDGVVVYVNGTEVGRTNLPTGTLGQNSYATAAPRSGPAAAARVEYSVPSSLLVAGTNVVAVSIHANYRSTPDLSFDLRFTAKVGQPPAAPAAPVVTGSASDSTTAQLSWTQPAGSAVTEYRVSRDGNQVGVVAAPGLTFTDTGLTPETGYAYSVVAVNGFGQLSAPGTANVTTPAGPVDPNVAFIANGSSWKWQYSSTALPAGWNATAFDDSGWSTGSARLGFGTTGLATDISVGVPTPRPLSAQFRSPFTVADPGTILTAQLSVIADDGVVVYLNGTEIARGNMPTGTLGQNSYATAAPSSATAAANRIVVDVPVNLLVAGTNVIAASTHLNYRSTANASFDLSLNGTR